MTDPAIEITKLKKRISVGFFGRVVHLLRGIDLTVAPGSVFGFIGPNGAGKSSTIKVLIGAARPSSGTARVLGGSPRDRGVRARIGYLPEFPQLPDTLTPRELLRLHGRLAGVAPSALEGRIDDVLARIELADRGDDRIGGFSKGLKQRAGLGLALVGEPELLILDEPMSGLDPLGRRLVRSIIREQAEQGATVFFSSHVLPDVESLCDAVALVQRGKVVTTGSIDEVTGGQVLGWDIHLEPGPDGVPQAVAALGDLRMRGNRGHLRVPVEGDPVEVARRAQQEGSRVIEIEALRPSLEDRLVALVEHEEATAEVAPETGDGGESESSASKAPSEEVSTSDEEAA